MKKLRDKIFIWPSWVCKLVAGEEQCEWKYWLKAHYQTDKRPSSFNLASWTIAHNKLIRKRREELEAKGFTVRVEDQNSFKYSPAGKNYTISGKADIVAIKAGITKVEDGKTGNQKTSDYVQVVFYMIILPKAHPDYIGKTFEGTIVYKDGVPNANIPSSAVHDKTMVEEIKRVIDLISGEESKCRRVPSFNECKKCDVTIEDCPARM